MMLPAPGLEVRAPGIHAPAESPADHSNSVTLRKFPYPYQAMLAISSDADGMTLRKFVLLHRFLNTREATPYGRGLGLDVSDSFFFFIGADRTGSCDVDGTRWADQMSWFRRLSPREFHDAEQIAWYAKAGWIDTLHSLGDFSALDLSNRRFDRAMGLAAARELVFNHLRFRVWVNHGNAANAQNFGDPKSAYQEGDLSDSSRYVTDLFLPLGVQYVWLWRSSVPGLPEVLHPVRLRDGRTLWGFYRYTDDGQDPQGDVKWNWNPRLLHRQLSSHNLRILEKKGLYSIIAQHLGGAVDQSPLLPQDALALRRLSAEYERGRILVARTSRLLVYNTAQKHLAYRSLWRGGRLQIRLDSIRDPMLGWQKPTLDSLRGMTFYTPYPGLTDILLGGRPLPAGWVRKNPPDETGRASIQIRWWPRDVLDYSRLSPRPRAAVYGWRPSPAWRSSPELQPWRWTQRPL